MRKELIDRLNNFFKKNSVALGTKSTIEEIENAEKALNTKFDPDYNEFLLNWGGCIVGTSEIYGLNNCELLDEETVIELNESFREDNPEIPSDWLVIGSDYAGNPIAIDNIGKIVVDDHDSGTIEILASSFEEYIENSLI